MDMLIKILYAIPVYQSVALSLLLFMNGRKARSHSRIVMGVFQLICALYFAFNFLYALRSFEIIVNLYFLVLPVILLFLPLFYFYLLSVTTPGFGFKKKHLWHFLPALVILLANLPFLFISSIDRLEYISHSFDSSGYSPFVLYLTIVYIVGIYGLLSLQLIFYIYQAAKLYRMHQEYIENHYSFTENISLNWIVALTACLVIFFISNQMLYLFSFDRSHLSPVFYNLSMLGIGLFLGYYALGQKDLKISEVALSGSFHKKKDSDSQLLMIVPDAAGSLAVSDSGENAERLESPEVVDSSSPEKYAGSMLSDEHKSLLVSRLDDLIRMEKIFVNDNLSVEDVAIRLGTNSKYISQVINEKYGRNFYNFINAYRVEEAQKLLLSGGLEKYSMLGIAQMVGFGSKSSFNAYFKKITGLTPSEFVKTKP